MAQKAFIVTGLGYGDECKGSIVDWLAYRHHARHVIRIGAAQASHRVVRSNGNTHAFSQFGSGTLRGIPTHLSKEMVIDPFCILEEGKALMRENYLRDVYDLLTIHADALVITPFQAIAGRIRELMRGTLRHGSVGMGVGETILDSEVANTLCVRAGDLSASDLKERLAAIQERKWGEFEALADRCSILPAETEAQIRQELWNLEHPNTLAWALEQCTELAKHVRIVDTNYVSEKIFSPEGTVIVEGSQGVLLDREYGFHPFTTKVRPLPSVGIHLLHEGAYAGEIESMGVLRTYHTRHGAGPFVTESRALTGQLPDYSNRMHPWQGEFRVGYFDMVAARYAVDLCRESIDRLAITCVDRIPTSDLWEYCTAYQISPLIPQKILSPFFEITETGKILRIHAKKERTLEEKMQLTRFLGQCLPILTTCPKDSVLRHLEENLNLRIAVASHGPTERDKIEFTNSSSSF